MLGTASRELEELRNENEALHEGLERIESALESVRYAAPEIRDGAVHSLINVCAQVVGK
jgi:hypothetical protein